MQAVADAIEEQDTRLRRRSFSTISLTKRTESETRPNDILEDMFDEQALPKVNLPNESTPNDQKMFNRMTKRKNRQMFIFYPEDKCKSWWNIFMTLILLSVCVTTPLDIAFADINESFTILTFSFFVDMLFLVDMLVIFNSAYYTKDMDTIDDRKEICKNYI